MVTTKSLAQASFASKALDEFRDILFQLKRVQNGVFPHVCVGIIEKLAKVSSSAVVKHRQKSHQLLPLSVRYDHILKWELFQLADLDTYQGMLKLLFMKELEHIVKSYEAYRQALLSEVEARKQRQQWYAQQPNKNFMGNM